MEHITDPKLVEMRKELLDIRSRLYGDPMKDLIHDEMEQSDRNIKHYLAVSEGKFREVYVEVKEKGLSATDYFAWQSAAMRKAIAGDPEEKKRVTIETVFPAHPEHYMILDSGVVETLGGLPTNASVCRVDPMPQFLIDCADDSYFGGKNSGVKLADGTVWSYGLTEYRDTEDGASMKLHVFWPEKCPEIFFADHARHFAVEYRNFIHMAYDALKGTDKIKSELEICFDTSFGPADETRVDEWEMMAAQRALDNLHALLKNKV